MCSQQQGRAPHPWSGWAAGGGAYLKPAYGPAQVYRFVIILRRTRAGHWGRNRAGPPGFRWPQKAARKRHSELAEEGQAGASVPGTPGNSDAETLGGGGDGPGLGRGGGGRWRGGGGGTLEGVNEVVGFSGIRWDGG